MRFKLLIPLILKIHLISHVGANLLIYVPYRFPYCKLNTLYLLTTKFLKQFELNLIIDLVNFKNKNNIKF